jgi:hypothetical protein
MPGELPKPRLPKYPFDPEYATRAAQQRRWEHRVVCRILKHYGLIDDASEMMTMARDQTGMARLTLEAFHIIHPTFPLWLAAEKIPYVHKTTISELLTSLPDSKVYDGFSTAEIYRPAAFAHSGLVFEWLHSPWAMAIIHDENRRIRKRALAIEFMVNGHLLVLQSFASFLESLVWSPTSEADGDTRENG